MANTRFVCTFVGTFESRVRLHGEDIRGSPFEIVASAVSHLRPSAASSRLLLEPISGAPTSGLDLGVSGAVGSIVAVLVQCRDEEAQLCRIAAAGRISFVADRDTRILITTTRYNQH